MTDYRFSAKPMVVAFGSAVIADTVNVWLGLCGAALALLLIWSEWQQQRHDEARVVTPAAPPERP